MANWCRMCAEHAFDDAVQRSVAGVGRIGAYPLGTYLACNAHYDEHCHRFACNNGCRWCSHPQGDETAAGRYYCKRVIIIIGVRQKNGTEITAQDDCNQKLRVKQTFELLRLQPLTRLINLANSALLRKESSNHCTQICINKGVGTYTSLNVEFLKN